MEGRETISSARCFANPDLSAKQMMFKMCPVCELQLISVNYIQ